MNRISAATRISIAIVCLTITVLLGAQTLGLLPNAFQEALDGRKKLCESLAIYCLVVALILLFANPFTSLVVK